MYMYNNDCICYIVHKFLIIIVVSTYDVHIHTQVVDMRWGVRDEASDDHSASDLCMKELSLCQNLSIGPAFVVSIYITGVSGMSPFW